MKYFDVDEILQSTRYMMEIMGNWPLQNSFKAYSLRVLWISTVTVFSIASCIQGFMDFSFENMSFSFCCSIIASLPVAKFSILYFNKPKFLNILSSLRHPSLFKHEDYLDPLLKRKIYICSILRKMYLSSVVAVMAIMTLSTALKMNSDRLLPVPFPVDMKKQCTTVFVLVWSLQSLAAGLISWNGSSFDFLLFAFMEIAVAQLQMLKTRIANFTNTSASGNRACSSKEDNNSDAIQKMLRKCVIQHNAIERYIYWVQETFTLIFLVQLNFSLIIFCMVGFNCVLFPITSFQFGRSIFIFSTVAIQLILYCIPGDEILVESQKIGDACYMLPWEGCDLSIQKSILLIMLRSGRPLKLAAFNFIALSLETLVIISKSAFSYFTVLMQLYSDSKDT